MANLRNTEIVSGSLKLPVGNTAQRPSNKSGYIRFNTEQNSVEFFNSNWKIKRPWQISEVYRDSPNYTPHLLLQIESYGGSYTGSGSNVKRQHIEIDGNVVLSSNSPRSYRLTKLSQNQNGYWSFIDSNGYDVYGSTSDADAALAFLQSFNDGEMLVLNTYDEPVRNRERFIPTLVQDFGSNLEIYRPLFNGRDAHILISIKGSNSPIFEEYRERQDARIVMSAWWG